LKNEKRSNQEEEEKKGGGGRRVVVRQRHGESLARVAGDREPRMRAGKREREGDEAEAAAAPLTLYLPHRK